MLLQQSEPDDYVLATGEARSVREFVEIASSHIGRGMGWRGTGTQEMGLDAKSAEALIKIAPRYFRPTEVDLLVGDASKARQKLGWTSRTTFAELVSEMIRSDRTSTSKEIASAR